jgi:hypothetical protein
MGIDVLLEKLTDEELDSKILALQKIIFSLNQNLSLQAQNLLGQYIDEQSERSDKKLEEYTKKRNMKKEEDDNDGCVLNIG